MRISKKSVFIDSVANSLSFIQHWPLILCLEQVTNSGITLIGYTDLSARLPTTASELFAKNVVNFVLSLSDAKQHKGAMIINPDKVIELKDPHNPQG